MSGIHIDREYHDVDGVPVLQLQPPSEILEPLTNPKGPQGKELRDLVHVSSRAVTRAFIDDMGRENLGKKPLVVSIPRGGIPVGTGVHATVSQHEANAALVYSNSGEGHEPSRGKLPQRPAEEVTSVFIADGVVGSGNETIAHLDALFAHLTPEEIRMVGFISIAAATFGLRNIATHMEQTYPEIPYSLSTMRIYREGEYKGWTPVGERQVFFVGVGDYGQRVQGELTTEALYALYGIQRPKRN